MGIGLAGGATLVAGLFSRARPWQRIVCAILGAMWRRVVADRDRRKPFSASLEIVLVCRKLANSMETARLLF